jgi:hypothetical protein
MLDDTSSRTIREGCTRPVVGVEALSASDTAACFHFTCRRERRDAATGGLVLGEKWVRGNYPGESGSRQNEVRYPRLSTMDCGRVSSSSILAIIGELKRALQIQLD